MVVHEEEETIEWRFSKALSNGKSTTSSGFQNSLRNVRPIPRDTQHLVTVGDPYSSGKRDDSIERPEVTACKIQHNWLMRSDGIKFEACLLQVGGKAMHELDYSSRSLMQLCTTRHPLWSILRGYLIASALLP